MSFHENKPEVLKQVSLELEDDISFFKKDIVAQRIGWVLMFLIILVGCLGVFGTGVLSMKTLKGRAGSVEYERFMRFDNETELRFRCRHTAGNLTLSLPLAYLQCFRIEDIIPEPSTSELSNERMIYHFTSSGKAEVRMAVKPGKTGNITGTVVLNGEPLQLSHFVYP